MKVDLKDSIILNEGLELIDANRNLEISMPVLRPMSPHPRQRTILRVASHDFIVLTFGTLTECTNYIQLPPRWNSIDQLKQLWRQ